MVVPDVELVVQRSGEADSDEVADEQGADHWTGGENVRGQVMSGNVQTQMLDGKCQKANVWMQTFRCKRLDANISNQISGSRLLQIN